MIALDNRTDTPAIRLGPWRYYPSLARISDDGEQRQLTPNQNKALKAFLEAPEHTLQKQAFADAVWPNRVVTDDAISRLISDLRARLHHHQEDKSLIKTLHGHGFCLRIKPITETVGPTYRRIAMGAGMVVTVLGVLLIIFTAPWGSRPDPLIAWQAPQISLKTDLDPYATYFASVHSLQNRHFKIADHGLELQLETNDDVISLHRSAAPIRQLAVHRNGRVLAMVSTAQSCEIKIFALDTTTWQSMTETFSGSCDARQLQAIAWSDSNTLVAVHSSQPDQFDIQSIAVDQQPRTRRITIPGCRKIRDLKTSSASHMVVSCQTTRGDELIRITPEGTEVLLRYRSIRRFDQDPHGNFYLLHDPSWKNGITRFSLPERAFAFAEIGWPADLMVHGQKLVVVRDFNNPQLIGWSWVEQRPVSLQESRAHTRSFAIDPSTTHLWQIDDRSGQFQLWENGAVATGFEHGNLPLDSVLDMAVNTAQNWLLLTTQTQDQAVMHWYTLKPQPQRVQRVTLTSPQIEILDDAIRFQTPEVSATLNTATGKISHTESGNAQRLDPPLPCVPQSPGWKIELTSSAQIIMTPENGVRRPIRWQDSRVQSLCDIQKIIVDDHAKRVLYLINEPAFQDIAWIALDDKSLN